MALRGSGGAGATRVLGLCLVLLGVLAAPRPGPAQMTTVAYRETADSFSWEIDWDGAAPPGEAEYLPLRPDPALPELWAPAIRLSLGRKGFRCTFRARHKCRVHEMDAPGGARLQLTFPTRERLKGPEEWARVETRAVLHLHTGKDHKDEYDLLARTDVDAMGKKVYRLVLQGAHGLVTKPKKLKTPKREKKQPPRH